TTSMIKPQWLLALPVVLAATLAGSARAATIRDDAGMFSPEAVSRAEATLDQVERSTGINTTIQTIDSLDGQPIDDLLGDKVQRLRGQALYALIAKKDHKFE